MFMPKSVIPSPLSQVFMFEVELRVFFRTVAAAGVCTHVALWMWHLRWNRRLSCNLCWLFWWSQGLYHTGRQILVKPPYIFYYMFFLAEGSWWQHEQHTFSSGHTCFSSRTRCFAPKHSPHSMFLCLRLRQPLVGHPSVERVWWAILLDFASASINREFRYSYVLWRSCMLQEHWEELRQP